MNDLNVVVMLTGAIQSLEARKATLAPLEQMKLKTMRLNLETAQRAVPATHHDALDDRCRHLHTLSATVLADARSLLQEVRRHIAHARSLSDEVRLALTTSERICTTIREPLTLPAREHAWTSLPGLPSH